ncbi:MAG TPA: hypothetical protein VJB87_04640 [Candidatus Nanoarchaeia archaeon]|nr:hypothetical protein [Candidatus Nanoarchaeia archaeon]
MDVSRIKPADIHSNCYVGGFGRCESENIIKYLLTANQRLGHWSPATIPRETVMFGVSRISSSDRVWDWTDVIAMIAWGWLELEGDKKRKRILRTARVNDALDMLCIDTAEPVNLSPSDKFYLTGATIARLYECHRVGQPCREPEIPRGNYARPSAQLTLPLF